MKNTLKINHENRTLVMDRTFAKAASFVGSNEYNLLQDARRDYPSYQVTLRSIKKKEDKESYRGLTYKYMEDYIRTHANAAANMAEYKQQRSVGRMPLHPLCKHQEMVPRNVSRSGPVRCDGNP